MEIGPGDARKRPCVIIEADAFTTTTSVPAAHALPPSGSIVMFLKRSDRFSTCPVGRHDQFSSDNRFDRTRHRVVHRCLFFHRFASSSPRPPLPRNIPARRRRRTTQIVLHHDLRTSCRHAAAGRRN